MMNDALKRCAVAGLCIIAVLLPASAAFGSVAQATDPAAPGTTAVAAAPDPSGFGLTVSPTRLVVGPADIGKPQQVKVINLGTEPLALEASKRDFTGAADGTMVFQDTAAYSASSWVTTEPSSFALPAGATQIVTVTMTVPPSPELGDHQVALVFVSPAGQTSGNVKINRGIGIPLYVTVPGATDDSATVSDLVLPGFMASGSTSLSATVTNTGTVHRDFRGSDRLAVGGSGSAEPFPDFTVPRDTKRIVTTSWQPPAICICHPSISIVNADGTVSEVTATVVVFPWPWVVGALVAGLVIWLGVRFSRRRYRATIAREAALLSESSAAVAAATTATPTPSDELAPVGADDA